MLALMFMAALVVNHVGPLADIVNACAPGNAPGPKQLSNAPEPNPSTSGPDVLPAAYTTRPGAKPLDAGSVRNAALAPKSSANSIPSNYLKLYKAAASDKRFGGIPWYILAGIGKVETDHGRSKLPGVASGENYAGAGGPMQFLQGTWNGFAIDGPTFGPDGAPDGKPDGKTDRYNPADAIFTAANYLHHSGAPGDTRKAIYAYNHSWDYVDLVLSWANKYGGDNFSLDDPNYAGFSCGTSDSTASEFGKRIIEDAEKWLGTRYVYGGGDLNGPYKGGFDCSSLVRYAVYHASDGQIKLPRVAADQQRDPRGKRVSRSELQPGDLVFFTAAGAKGAHHVGIYVGGGKMVNAPHTGAVVRVEAIGWKEFSGGMRFTMTVKA
ncbi:NlpC/P60 family protein [Spirillospora sp. NPDC047418]